MPVSQQAIPLVVVFTLFLAIAFLAVGLRLHVRITLLKNPGWDDWLCLASACCALATYLSNMGTVAVGFGNPLPSLTPENRQTALQTLWISPPLWGLSSALIKMSIVASYLRIWSSKPFKLFCRLLLFLIAVFGLTLFFGGVLACVPVQLSWTPPNARDGGHCIDLPRFMFVTSTLNTAVDLLIFAVPVPLVRRLQIARRQRVALLIVFTIGAVVCVASVLRLVSIYQLLRVPTDPSSGGVALGLWSGVELTLAVICACLPTLRPVVARVFPRLLHTTVNSSPSWVGTGTGTGTRRGTQRATGDENGTYRMRELPSNDFSSDDNKPGGGDVERGVIRVKSTIDINVEQDSIPDLSVDKHDRSVWI
ncbi:hypothetical protein F4820DRAFT_460636 [Hypoxylon rubiginosum]|uniref:Uncharacterized protein n=1 Tax=Hypoxylon rubiginosum TaxID=110542 RepID=A0ACB9YR11_9PEZI|nr:hypothetical protein F4820DRAFT_460636 [Hypoxylon rubiginosum]